MLQEICEHLHNWDFKKGRVAYAGTYTIAVGGLISLPFLKDGQRFQIIGSDLNDGVYTYHEGRITNDDDNEAAGLRAESFAGTIYAMAVPPNVIALAGEISEWVANNADAMASPYQSENVIGVYSYTKATGGSGAGGSITWQDQFKSQLDRWRKLCV